MSVCLHGNDHRSCDECLHDLTKRQLANQKKEKEQVNHPSHYGGDTVYETIKVIEAWQLNFNIGNTVKYLSRAGKKSDDILVDLKKASWYLNREIARIEREKQHVQSESGS